MQKEGQIITNAVATPTTSPASVITAAGTAACPMQPLPAFTAPCMPSSCEFMYGRELRGTPVDDILVDFEREACDADMPHKSFLFQLHQGWQGLLDNLHSIAWDQGQMQESNVRSRMLQTTATAWHKSPNRSHLSIYQKMQWSEISFAVVAMDSSKCADATMTTGSIGVTFREGDTYGADQAVVESSGRLFCLVVQANAWLTKYKGPSVSVSM